MRRLNVADVTKIANEAEKGYRYYRIAENNRISVSTVSRIIREIRGTAVGRSRVVRHYLRTDDAKKLKRVLDYRKRVYETEEFKGNPNPKKPTLQELIAGTPSVSPTAVAKPIVTSKIGAELDKLEERLIQIDDMIDSIAGKLGALNIGEL